MTERLGAVAYRHLAARAVLLGFGDGDSLQNIITDPLNDGCLCYVVEFAGYYQLDKRSVADPIDFVIIKPLAGPGRWLFFASATESVSWFSENLIVTPQILDFTTGPVPAGTWVNPPSGGGFYSSNSPSPLFTPNSTTGFVTYNGITKQYLVTVHASVASATADATSIEVVPDTGGLVSTTTDDFNAQRAMTVAVIDAEVQISASKIFNLAAGQALRPIFRNLTSTNNLSVERLSMFITAVT